MSVLWMLLDLLVKNVIVIKLVLMKISLNELLCEETR